MRAADGLWAVGDVTGEGAFTHMAMYQAGIVVRDILGQPGPPRRLPGAAPGHLHRPRGRRGRPDRGSRPASGASTCGSASTPVPSSTRGWIHKAGQRGFIKLVADADRGVLVGATSAGPAGGEVLGALAVAVHAQVPVRRCCST